MGDVRLHCAIGGAGPLLLLLHGFPENWHSWHRQIAPLAARFRVVAPDLRGYGDSDRPIGVDAYRLPALVEDVRGLVAAFGEREAVIVGHDWGGIIAWMVATTHPGITRRLVLLNAPHPGHLAERIRIDARQRLRSWYILFFQIPRLPELLLGLGGGRAVARLVQRSAVRRDGITADHVRALRAGARRPGALRSALHYYRAVGDEPWARGAWPVWLRRFLHGVSATEEQPALDDWPKVRAPTLVVWGEQDVALGIELTESLERFVDAPLRIHRIPDSGHWVHQEHPDLVTGLLLDFLGDLDLGATRPPSSTG